MKLSLEKFKKYLDDEYSIEDLEQYEEALADRLFTLRKAMDMGSRVKIKGFGMSEAASILEDVLYESLRDWFKKEKWVRISSSGKIAGPCGTSKNKKNPDRCLPKAKAQSLSKGERAATAAKKKRAGKKGKTVVKNTKKATVKKENVSGDTRAEAIKLKADLKQLKVNHVSAMKKVVNKRGWENPGAVYYRVDFTLRGYEDRASKEEHLEILNKINVPEGWSIYWWEPRMYFFKGVDGPTPLQWITSKDLDDTAEPIKETKEAPAGHYFTKSGNLVKGRMSKDAKERGARKSDPKDKMRSKVPPVSQTREDIRNLVVGLLHEIQNEGTIEEKDDRCTRLAKQKYDTWPSAYASGAVVRCRRGEIWKKK